MNDPRLRTIAQWGLLLWGPLVWSGHFLFVYAAASLELSLRPTAGAPSRIAIAVATVAALLALWAVLRTRLDLAPGEAGSGLTRFWIASTRMLCLISAIAILFQALPALLVP